MCGRRRVWCVVGGCVRVCGRRMCEGVRVVGGGCVKVCDRKVGVLGLLS